jgi:hypothetical protein
MIRLSNQPVEISFRGYAITGVLQGTPEGWSFHSHDYYFMELFPAGVVYSFSHHGPGALYSQMLFKEEVAKKAKALVLEHCFRQKEAAVESTID